MCRELAETIIDAWDQDKLKGKFWHDVVYQQCYPIMQGKDDQSARISELEQQLAALQANRKPLSEDELDKLRQSNDGKYNYVTLREFKNIARAIEVAHGITGEYK